MQCRVCHSTAEMLGHTLKQCAGCGRAVYCSRKCQKEDWPDHKVAHGYNENFDVQVTLLSGTTYVVQGCAEKLRISALKAKLGELAGIPAWEQTLCLGTRVLSNKETLLQAGVRGDSCVSLVMGEDREEDDEDEDIPPAMVDSSSDEAPAPAMVDSSSEEES